MLTARLFPKQQYVQLMKTAFQTQKCALATTASLTMPSQQTAEDYFTKNKRLNRPISPHLTIYKPQLTSMLSVSHRATGIILSTGITTFSISMLVASGSFPHYLEALQAMHYGGLVIFAAKFAIALPFMFHLCNGVRHLVWDLGYGFSLRTLYKTGYGVLGLSILLSLLVSAM